jgi:hypothetical protein
MEYIYYLLIILCLLVACLYALRTLPMVRPKTDKPELSKRERRRRIRTEALADISPNDDRLRHHQEVLERSLASVPTPWGWPGHDDTQKSPGQGHGDTVSESFHKWVDLLVREKQTVDDQAYRSRANASLKALLEDRYASGAVASTVDYKKTRAPLLRDPNDPHDQMDNFPSGRAGQIVDGLERQPADHEPKRFLSDSGHRRAPLKEVRTPWGW